MEDYNLLLESMSRKWHYTQLHHEVSATAADKFWQIAKSFWPKLVEAKQVEGVKRKTPEFQNQRKKIVKQLCPDIHMEFGFLNVNTGAIHKVATRTAPFKEYERNPNFIKLYEEAHVKVTVNFP